MVPIPSSVGQGGPPALCPTHCRVRRCRPTMAWQLIAPHGRCSQGVHEPHGPQCTTSGQGPWGPQSARWVLLPGQPRPPCRGGGASQARRSLTTPSPHVTEQGVASDHAPQAPSSGHGGRPGHGSVSVPAPVQAAPGGSNDGGGESQRRLRLRLGLCPDPRHDPLQLPHGPHGPHEPPTGHLGVPPGHSRLSSTSPGPQPPPQLGAGSAQARPRLCVPAPHVTEQLPHGDHEVQPPGSGQQGR